MDGFRAKKKYGQNFLSDMAYSERIGEAAMAKKGGNVFEIGPGGGVLTRILLRHASHVDAIEIDEDLRPVLSRLEGEYKGRLSVTFGDFMKIPVRDLLKMDGEYSVFANIPYYITAPIIERLIGSRDRFDEIYLTVQKEAAERICAPAGSRESGAFSFFVEYHAERELLFEIPREAFTPAPKVDSAFIRLKIRREPPCEAPYSKIEPVVRTAFSQRRKSLRNSLKRLSPDISDVLERAGVSPESRPEKLALSDFARIAGLLV